jgi:uncharacterized SAM-binding protein YcdF (DUF218 family)
MARTLALCVILSLLLAAAACPYAGHYLIVDDPLQPADAIIVLDGGAERWLEGVELYREKVAPQIVLSPGMDRPAETRVRQMGIRYPVRVELAQDAMVQLGVPPSAIYILPKPVDNTADEASETKAAAVSRGWKHLVVVTSKYHTRRTLFAFQREFRGTGIHIQVHGSRYDRVTPDGWWRSRSDLRYVVSELQKLAAYRLGLGK